MSTHATFSNGIALGLILGGAGVAVILSLTDQRAETQIPRTATESNLDDAWHSGLVRPGAEFFILPGVCGTVCSVTESTGLSLGSEWWAVDVLKSSAPDTWGEAQNSGEPSFLWGPEVKAHLASYNPAGSYFGEVKASLGWVHQFILLFEVVDGEGALFATVAAQHTADSTERPQAIRSAMIELRKTPERARQWARIEFEVVIAELESGEPCYRIRGAMNLVNHV